MKGHIVFLTLASSVVNISAEASWRSGSSFRTGDLSQKEVTRHWSSFDPISAIKEQVDSMRGKLCWLRGSVLEHEDCMEWLIPKCKGDDVSDEDCLKLKNLAREQCSKGDTKACSYAKQLGLDVHMVNQEDTHIEQRDKASPPASIMDPSAIMAPTPAQAEAKAAVTPPDVKPPDAIQPPQISKGKAPAPAEKSEKSTWKNPIKKVKEWASKVKDYIAGGGDETTPLVPAPSPALAQAPEQAATQAPAQAVTQAATQAPAPAAQPTTETTTQQKTTEAAKVTKPETTTAPKSTPSPQAISGEDEPLIPSGDASPGGYIDAKPGAKLQSQGFSGKKVRHEDFKTYAADWQNEYGHPTEPPKKSDAWKTGGLALPVLLVYLAASAPRY